MEGWKRGEPPATAVARGVRGDADVGDASWEPWTGLLADGVCQGPCPLIGLDCPDRAAASTSSASLARLMASTLPLHMVTQIGGQGE